MHYAKDFHHTFFQQNLLFGVHAQISSVGKTVVLQSQYLRFVVDPGMPITSPSHSTHDASHPANGLIGVGVCGGGGVVVSIMFSIHEVVETIIL